MRHAFRMFATLLATISACDRTLAADLFDMVPIPGGAFVMGDAQGDANEAPRNVSVTGFSLMRTEVTNAQFAAFVAETGHRTDVERAGAGYVWTDRWRLVPGAQWRSPTAGTSGLSGLDDHPVVQVSANDAAVFCAHYGLRLPTEKEWEFAARGPDQRRYPWGDEPPAQQAGVAPLANFGTVACCSPDDSDGYGRTAPVGRFPEGASPFGLLDMAGNVWEWTASRFPGRPEHRVIRGGGWGNNPYCLRTSYRHGNPPEFGLDMVGFRCAGP